jgi:hypothetical protein
LGTLLSALPLGLLTAHAAEMACDVRLIHHKSGSWGATFEELCRERSL